ncbi:coproporphyrinogen-III oxidase family protein [Micromonospora sp. LOL_024]|uniref:coproporphyrinogen-III oxidase family protein n=1 Tax=Micromonospora sp. LOL_024 TaxID=3345412 RepID=UPI003A8C15F8
MATVNLEAPTTMPGAEPEPRSDGAYVFHHPPKFMWQRDAEVPERRWGRYSVYVHVPFCRKICTFCTFERKRLRRSSIPNFTARLWEELDTVQNLDDFSAAAVHSVYIGGGTGSLLPNADIVRLIGELRDRFGLAEAEVTLESEPGTKTQADLEEIRAGGVNRISIGIQAFQDDLLRRLNRSHTTEQALRAVRDAKAAGFEDVHIDLMYGLPGQSVEMWRETLDQAVDLGVPHISAYQLIVFQDELLDRAIRLGESPAPAPREEIHRMRVMCHDRLAEAGLPPYSLTEFARPGHHCDYVITTWDGSDYLGLGPAAYSRNGRWLWENDVIHAAYDESVRQGRRPVGKAIEMTPRDQLARDLAMSLCMLRIDVAPLEAQAGVTVEETFAAERDTLIAEGLLLVDGSRWTLTADGVRYATEVMKRFATG